MALNDIKSFKENAGGTYDEVLLASVFPLSAEIRNIVQITQAAYTALTPKVSTTMYVIVG